eukprot:scaffold77219_cov52-Phaeocystis_antarctica.AAC.2
MRRRCVHRVHGERVAQCRSKGHVLKHRQRLATSSIRIRHNVVDHDGRVAFHGMAQQGAGVPGRECVRVERVNEYEVVRPHELSAGGGGWHSLSHIHNSEVPARP